VSHRVSHPAGEAVFDERCLGAGEVDQVLVSQAGEQFDQ
jgi:hypothetical protein